MVGCFDWDSVSSWPGPVKKWRIGDDGVIAGKKKETVVMTVSLTGFLILFVEQGEFFGKVA